VSYCPPHLEPEKVRSQVAARVGTPIREVALELAEQDFYCEPSAVPWAGSAQSFGCSRYNMGTGFVTESMHAYLSVELVASRDSRALKEFKVFTGAPPPYARACSWNKPGGGIVPCAPQKP
jgi:hypothetical protein